MSDETTTDVLVEIEEQAADTPATEYTPPEGWRVLAVGERLRDGDVTVCRDGSQYPADRLGGWVGSNQRYIRAIEPEPQPQPQPQAEAVQVREGRWRTRGGEVKNIRPCEPLKGAHFVWPWTDGIKTFQDNGRHLAAVSDNDLVEYLGPIELEPQQVNDWPSVRDLRHELKTAQTQLGESRQRVAQLEELVASLRTINEATEKTVRAAGQENTDLQHRLEVVSAEWAEQVETSRKLRIELDAAQQVPQPISDRFEEGWDAGTSQAVETVLEWLEPIRATIEAADNVQQTMRADNLACDIIRNLPAIMRSLTGLTPED